MERAILLASALMSLNLLVGFISSIVSNAILMSTIAAAAAFLEFGILLILGSCLLSRQPLENRDRYNEDGSHTTSYRVSLIGKQMLIAAIFLFLYSILITIVAMYLTF